MNRNDVIDVLAIVAAASRRTIGETDVQIWQEIIGTDDRDLAVKAVADQLREQPGVWIEPGHIHQRVRAMVRDQLDRQPLTEQETRLDALTAKAVDELAETKTIPNPEPRYQRQPSDSPIRVGCPWCHANPGQPCTLQGTGQRLTKSRFHPSRTTAAQEATP